MNQRIYGASQLIACCLIAATQTVPAADLHGFFDARGGRRTQTDPHQRETSLAETRLQLEATQTGDNSTLQLRTDFLYDNLAADHDIDLEDGSGFMDLREANIMLYPLNVMDIKIGRQILTWGNGDLVFINDMFPKDWQSFLSGRDEEYLKAPSDAVYASLFPSFANIQLVYTPRFDADRYIRGERLSYWNPLLGRVAGRDAVIKPDQPDHWLDHDELAARVYKIVSGYELAVYGYDGYWKSPEGFDLESGRATFPRLSVYGASARGTLAGGILSLEAGHYDSRDDRNGDDPLTPNSEIRALIGYEHELVRNLTASFQYYVEHMRDYSSYISSLPEEGKPQDQDRHVITTRLTQLALNQNMTLSLFAFYSPSDQDAYLRPVIRHKLSDALLLTLGGNIFIGEKAHTFFGQFEDNSNIYAGMKYSW